MWAPQYSVLRMGRPPDALYGPPAPSWSGLGWAALELAQYAFMLACTAVGVYTTRPFDALLPRQAAGRPCSDGVPRC